jgi:dTDP-4-amino-4,6-dideoxygalactose transaminase
VAEASAAGALKAGGEFTRRCEQQLAATLGVSAVLLVHSCTAALELAVLLLDIQPGDEVIMPSFGFPSSANAVVLRGAVPVFVDVDAATLNVDPAAVATAVTKRTKAIIVTHYAGVAADMAALAAIAARHGLTIVEDAAQGIGAGYGGRALGSIGTLGAISFDATKNLSCGSGGALVVNDPALIPAAEALRDYGTDRGRFGRGEVDRYRWIQVGSNYRMNELAAAYLWPQLGDIEPITRARRRSWRRYHEAFAPAEAAGLLQRLVVPAPCRTNGHIFGFVLPTAAGRTLLLDELRGRGVEATFHYVPLHSAPAGQVHGRAHGDLSRTDDLSRRLLRLPLYAGITESDQDHVVASVCDVLSPGSAESYAA